MRNIYRSLLLLIAGATQKELARQIHYLKIENRILRSKLPHRVPVTAQERNRLVRFGCKLGKVLNELVTIVHPSTLLRWIREDRKGKNVVPVKRGRRPTALQIRRLILKLARENNWGYTRILGELKKLGIQSPSRNTVKNILTAQGFDPGPKRGVNTWDEFLKIHASTLWQCDFFSKKVLTPKGFRDLFVLVFLHVGSRRVFVTNSTYHPNEAWVRQQGATFLHRAKDSGLKVDLLFHDRDTKFTAAFDNDLRASNVTVRRSPYRSPNTLAFVERFIQTLKHEVLDYFIAFGAKHLDFLVSEAVAHYHAERPHQGLDNELIVLPRSSPSKKKSKPAVVQELTISLSSVGCRKRLGGLLKHYYRKAA